MKPPLPRRRARLGSAPFPCCPAGSVSWAPGPMSGAPIWSCAGPGGCWHGSGRFGRFTSRNWTSGRASSSGPRICALTETLGVEVRDDAALRLMARIEDDLVTFSLDTSGEPLHRRGYKEAVGKAPMRETLAALFLRQCGYDGSEPVLDPMCGSGTFPIEAAEIATGLWPGRARRFAFEDLAGFDAQAWAAMRQGPAPRETPLRFYGFDRDAGAVRMATENAARAGVGEITQFACQPISALTRPEGPPGLVMINPPYGARIGNRKLLFGLYASLGEVLRREMRGWRVGLVTSDGGLAKSTGLPFLPAGPPVAHGGLKVTLWRTDPL